MGVIVNKIVKKEGWKFAFLMRLSPILPLWLFNYACSVTSMSVAANCVACIGSLPTIAFWVWTSASATNAAASKGGTQSRQRVIISVAITIMVSIPLMFLVR